MRISILLKREPFARIFAETLSRYWSNRYGCEHRVAWGRGGSGQRWWGNSYLNFFAAAGTPPETFEALRREYSRSRSTLRRPAQKMYVSAATTFPSLRWFSNVSFAVSPSVLDAGRMLVLGGNHRLRLLEPANRTSTVILKSGLGPQHIAGEIEMRTALSPECAPKMLEANRREEWFTEAYVPGTPINRLPGDEETYWGELASALLLRQVIVPSLEVVPIEFWRDNLLDRFRRLLESCSCPTGPALFELARAISEDAAALCPSRRLPCSWTHGDFQPANIITTGQRLWVIDWEGAAWRFSGYDFFQLAVGARRADGQWPHRVKKLMAENFAPMSKFLGPLLQAAGEAKVPTGWVLAYLLEEMLYKAADCAEPVYFQPGDCWGQLLDECRKIREAVLEQESAQQTRC